jgi:hypothetical protein
VVPCLVTAAAAGAHDRVWVEAAACAAVARGIALGLRDDEGTFPAWKLCVFTGGGLSRQVDARLGVVMVHQELTAGGGGGLGPGQIVGGSWKAGWEGG